ncbi:MAG: rhodanese-like domain-containing protein [Candidatus Nanopelagicales bacterium]
MLTSPRKRSARIAAVLAMSAVLVAPVGLAGCSNEPAAAPSTPTEAIAQPTTPQRVGVEAWMQAALSPGTVIIDVRTPEEYNAGHVAGAVNIPVEFEDFTTRISALDPGATYAVYCRTGNRSAAATAQMAGLGFEAIFDLDGGFTDLEAAGMPTA